MFGHVCNLFPGASSLKIGYVNENGPTCLHRRIKFVDSNF